MKKKIFFSLCCVFALIVPCLFFLCSCSSKSAYDIAVKNGFVGSESEWLASLKGKSAYELAVEKGFVGSESDWLASLTGKDGKDSVFTNTYDMYLSAKNNENYKGTYLEFLKALEPEYKNDSSVTLCSNLFSVFSVSCYSNIYAITPSTSGSAVLYSYNDDGSAYVVTNYHVAYSESSASFYKLFRLCLVDYSSEVEATCIGGSQAYDVAVLKISNASYLKNNNCAPVTLADHKLGETCYAIGDPRGAGIAITHGIVSTESDNVSMTFAGEKVTIRELRHDCYITHGNSGGGLFNADGAFIGLTNGGVVDRISQTEIPTGMNYAIPSSVVKAVADNIIDNTTAGKSGGRNFSLGINTTSNAFPNNDGDPSTGVTTETVSVEEIISNGLIATYNQTSAKKVEVGDIIVSISINETTQKITHDYQVTEFMLTARENDKVTLTLLRDGETFEIELTLTSNFASKLK